MNQLLDPISDIIDGKLSIPRMGHNFPIDLVCKGHPLYKYRIEGKIKYIVGYLNGDVKTYQHEVCHARFYLDPLYKKEMEELFYSFSSKSQVSITSFLSKLGYEERVWIDEFQAYYNTEKGSFFGIKEGDKKKGVKRK